MKWNNLKKIVFYFTDDVNCPWLAVDELRLLFDGNRLAGKFAKRFTGDEAFWIFETMVVDDGRLELKEKFEFLIRLNNYFDGFWTSVETMVFKPYKRIDINQ